MTDSHQEQWGFGTSEMFSENLIEFDVVDLGRMNVAREFNLPYFKVFFYLHLRGKQR